MAGVIENLYLSERMSDVTFYVGGKTNPTRFSAHKLIMANSSPVFEKMFEGEFKERTDTRIDIPDGDPIAFKSVLSFIYRRILLIQNVTHVCNIVYLVDKYDMDKNILITCVSYFLANMTALNCCEILNTIVQHPIIVAKNASKLLKAIWKTIAENAKEFARLEMFNQLSAEALDLVLRCDFLQISSEAAMVKVLVNWAEQRCLEENLPLTSENKKEKIGNMIYNVRFSCFSLKEFLNGPVTSELLSKQDKIQIANCISAEDESWRPLNKKHGCRRRIGTLVNRVLQVAKGCSSTTANGEAILVSFSHDVIFSQLQIWSQLAPVARLQITSLHRDEQWQIDNCKFVQGSAAYLPNGHAYYVFSLGIDDICLKANQTYKILLKLTVGYGMYIGDGIESGVQELVVNDRCFRFIFKVFRSSNVSLLEMEKDEDWIKLKTKLDEEEPNQLVTQHAKSVFSIFNFTICPSGI